MKKKISIFLLSFLVLTILSIWKLTEMDSSFTELESLFAQLIEYQENFEFEFVDMSLDGSYFYKIKDKNLIVLNHELNQVGIIDLPFSLKSIHQIRPFREKEMLLVVTKGERNPLNAISDYIQEKVLYYVNLETCEIKSLEDKFPSIFSAERISSDENYLYVKYFLNEQFAYGKIDLQTYTITSLDKFDFDGLLNIYNDDLKIASFERLDDNFKVYSGKGKLIYSDRIRKIENIHVTSSPFKHCIISDSLYFLDEKSGRYGTVRCFSIKDDELTNYEYILNEPFRAFTKINEKQLMLETISDTSNFASNETIIVPFEENIDQYSNFSTYFRNPNRRTVAHSNNLNHVLYLTQEDNIFYCIYENTVTNKQIIVYQAPNSCFSMKKEKIVIDTDELTPIECYGYIHEDENLRPTIIMLHGGPYWRYTKSSTEQCSYILHQLGFNVIELNYHGSEGLGAAYRDAVNESLPLKAKENVEDLLEWLILNTAIDKESVFLMGSSYGGYLSIFITSTIDFDFKYTIAIVPAPEENLIEMNDQEHRDVKNNPEQYLLETLMANNPKPIGVVYNYLDPQMTVKKNWDVIARRHSQLVVIDEFNSGHTPPLKSYKKVVELLVKLAGLDQKAED